MVSPRSAGSVRRASAAPCAFKFVQAGKDKKFRVGSVGVREGSRKGVAHGGFRRDSGFKSSNFLDRDWSRTRHRFAAF